jgi:23S rRNA (cytidine1920-2'-O)/16S rRNA (cytidine1409-2'-O)-methyltransferase
MKKRLDILVTEGGFAPSRTAAQALIMAGQVSINDRVVDKPGQTYPDDTVLQVKNASAYVSRGGDKLASVMEQFSIDFTDHIVVDVGSSTGGFTDYALQHGARKVYCIDTGTNQLAYKLREDDRVIVMEKTDVRDVESLPEKPTIAVTDVSFVALGKVLPSIEHIISTDGIIIALLKPQFEAGKAIADRFKGVISDDKIRQEIIDKFEASIVETYEILDAADSAVHGPKGNRERFYKLRARH